MSNIEFQRDHKGDMHLVVGEQFAVGSRVVGVQNIEGLGLTAIVWVPLKEASLGEVRNVVPLVRTPGK